jgi:hypothetical protein
MACMCTCQLLAAPAPSGHMAHLMVLIWQVTARQWMLRQHRSCLTCCSLAALLLLPLLHVCGHVLCSRPQCFSQLLTEWRCRFTITKQAVLQHEVCIAAVPMNPTVRHQQHGSMRSHCMQPLQRVLLAHLLSNCRTHDSGCRVHPVNLWLPRGLLGFAELITATAAMTCCCSALHSPFQHISTSPYQQRTCQSCA